MTKEVHFADRKGSQLRAKSSLAELVKVASEVQLMQGPLTAIGKDDDGGKLTDVNAIVHQRSKSTVN